MIRMFMFLQNSYVAILIPNDDDMESKGLGKYLDHKVGGALMDGNSTLIKEPPERCFGPPPSVDTASRCHL